MNVDPAPLRGPRVFATATDQPRMRRATDVITLVTSVIALAIITGFASPQPGFARALADLLASLPPMVTSVWQVGADLLVVTALVLLVTCAAGRRWAVARDLVVSATVALVVTVVASRLLHGEWPDLGRGVVRAEPPPTYPWTRLALPVAMIATAGPHLALPIRRFGRWMIVLGTLSGIALGASTVFGSVAAVLAGLIAASIVHLILGSSAGRPSLRDVGGALAEVGVDATDLEVAPAQRAGVFTVTGIGRGHGQLPRATPIRIKVYGRDAHGAAIVSALWRAIWYREPSPPVGFGRLQQVEHEAFLTLLAHQGGVLTDRVVTAGATESDDAVLVLEPVGTALPADDRVAVRRLWATVDALHRAGISHGQIDTDHLVVDGDQLGLIDLRTARVAPTELQVRVDRVQALVTLARHLGADDAVALVLEAADADTLTELLPLLQVPTLTLAQRRHVKQGLVDLDDLRTRAAAAAGAEVPALQQLYRFTIGSIVRIALPVIALFALVAAVSGLDVQALGQELSGATWWLIGLGAVLAQTPRIFQAISTMGASPVALPLGPVYALQLAISYVNLAIPTAAARVAVNIRFFQRHGVPPGAALASGALDGFSGFIVQALLLVTLLIATPLSLNLDVQLPTTGGAAHFALAAVSIAVVGIGVLLALGRLRRFVARWAKQIVLETLSVLRVLRSPRRLAMLFGGNLAAEILFALALGTFVRAFGVSVGLGELLLVVIAVSLLSGLLPIPGGIGVTEGGLIYGLVAFGVSEEVAFASVISYRLATFYLPPIWGFIALRWLERHRHI